MFRRDMGLSGRWIVLILLVGVARAHRGKEWYVSHKTGQDLSKCGYISNPCRTLRYAVSLADNGDVIYLDGQGSKNDPYGCEKPTAEQGRAGKFINKSLSVIGLHERAYLSCDHGLHFKSPANQEALYVSLNNLAFVRNGLSFTGRCNVSIFNCTFSKCFNPLNMTGTNMTLFLKKSVFENNTNCMKIQKNKKPRKGSGFISVDISGVVFINNYIPHTGSETGMVYVSNSPGTTAMHVRNTLFQENFSERSAFVVAIESCARNVGSLRMVNSSFLSTSSGVSVKGRFNMHFSNLTFVSSGRALYLLFSSLINESSSFITLEDSFFSNNSRAFFLAPSVQKANLTVKIRNCLFNDTIHQQNTQEPAMEFQERSKVDMNISYEISINNVTFHSIRGAALLLSQFTSKRKLNVSIENSWFLKNININFYRRTGYILHMGVTQKGELLCHSSKMASQVHLRNTRFEGNKAFFGVIFFSNVDVSFDNCRFTENYFFSAEGTLIDHGEGRGNLTIRKGNFTQPRVPTEEQTSNRSITRWPTFISSINRGHLVIEKTTFVASDTSSFYPVLTAIKEGSILLDPSTKIQCPVNTILHFNHWTREQKVLGYGGACTKNLSTLKIFCDNCPTKTYSLQRGCSAGLKPIQSDCQTCPYGATCLNGIKAKPNFWGYERHNSNLTFVPCPLGYCYPQNSSNVSDYNGCYGNRSGALCGACADRYSEELFSTKCRLKNKCHDDLFWVFTAAYSTALVLFLIFRQPFLSFLWRQIFWYKHPTREAIPSQETHFDEGYLKITFYFYQVVELLLLKNPEHLLSRINFLSAWVNLFDFEMQYFSQEAGCPFPGLTAVTKELFMCSRVFTTMACSVVIFLIHKGITKICGLEKPSLTLYLAVLMEILLLGYERLADTALSLLHCVPMGSDLRLFLDGNVQCWQWWQIELMAYIIVCVAPFILVLYFGSLSLYRNKVSAIEFLGACALPLPFLVRWAVQHVRKKDTMMRQNSSNGEEIKETLYEPFRTPSEKDNGTVYWESVLIGRRFLLLCLHSFIADPMFRLICLNCACVLILLHHVFKWPYRNMRANVCETVSLLALVAIATFNLAEGVFMSAGIEAIGPNRNGLIALEWAELALLGFLPFVFGVLVLFAFVSQLCRLATAVVRGFRKFLGIRERIGFGISEQQRPLLDPTLLEYS